MEIKSIRFDEYPRFVALVVNFFTWTRILQYKNLDNLIQKSFLL